MVTPDATLDGSVQSVIALVGSAGGLDAVSRVLGGLPVGLPAAVIVLIHQQPGHISHLTEILGGRCALPVVEARDGASLRPGLVVVAPSGKHVLVTPELATAVIVSGDAPPNRPSADLLLATLAVSAADRAVAVVLSGGGHDGATGATAVHALGGTVIASDEATSEVFSMPEATILRDHSVDQILPLDDIAALLVQLVAAGAQR